MATYGYIGVYILGCVGAAHEWARDGEHVLFFMGKLRRFKFRTSQTDTASFGLALFIDNSKKPL